MIDDRGVGDYAASPPTGAGAPFGYPATTAAVGTPYSTLPAMLCAGQQHEPSPMPGSGPSLQPAMEPRMAAMRERAHATPVSAVPGADACAMAPPYASSADTNVDTSAEMAAAIPKPRVVTTKPVQAAGNARAE